MSINPEAVQEIIDQAQEEYEERTILSNGLLHDPGKSFQYKTCEESQDIHAENLKRVLHKIEVTKAVDSIVSCEKTKFLNSLSSRKTETETISQDLANDLLTTVESTSVPRHLYLPNEPRFRSKLSDHGFQKEIGVTYKAEVHWVRPEYLDENTGLLINDGVYLSQKPQGETPVISFESESVPKDNSETRVKTHLRRIRGGKIEFNFRTDFTVFDLGRNVEITELQLPDLD